MYLVGLNFSSKVIIVVNTSRFKEVKNRKRINIIGVLLNIVFNIANL